MLEDVDIDQSVVSSAMISITETKVIDNIIEERKPVLHKNEKDTPMYGEIPEGCDNVKKVMEEVFPVLTRNVIFGLIYE